MAVAQPSYPTLFRTFVSRGIAHALDQVRQDREPPSTEVREFAFHSLSYGLRHAEAWAQVRELLLLLALRLAPLGYRDDWLAVLTEGIAQAQQVGDDEAVALLRWRRGILYQHQARHGEATAELSKALSYFQEVGDRYHQGCVLNRLAFVARRSCNFERAYELVGEAQRQLEPTADELGYSYLVLGTLAYDQTLWEEAHEAFCRSLAHWEATGSPWLRSQGLVNLGTVSRAMQRYEEAAGYYQQAIAVFEELGDRVNLAIAQMNLGNAFLRLERLEEALGLYPQAEQVFRQLHDRIRLAALHNNMGMLYQKLGRFQAAEQAFNASIEGWDSLNNIARMVNAMDNLGGLHVAQGRIAEAVDVLQRALDSLSQIQDEPTYQRLYRTVGDHLAACANGEAGI